MKAYRGTFVKKNGEHRELQFVRLSDIDKFNTDFLAERITEGGPPKRYGEGMELVWDLENDNFRVFNWSKTVDNVKIYNIDDSLFA